MVGLPGLSILMHLVMDFSDVRESGPVLRNRKKMSYINLLTHEQMNRIK